MKVKGVALQNDLPALGVFPRGYFMGHEYPSRTPQNLNRTTVYDRRSRKRPKHQHDNCQENEFFFASGGELRRCFWRPVETSVYVEKAPQNSTRSASNNIINTGGYCCVVGRSSVWTPVVDGKRQEERTKALKSSQTNVVQESAQRDVVILAVAGYKRLVALHADES